MKRKEKGSRGYIDGQKKKFGIMTAAFFMLVAAFFITGLILCKTRNNILTVMAILMVLPGAKFAVDLIMVLPYKPVTEELYNKLEAADDKFLHKYECIFTSKERAVYAAALVITDHTVCVYAPDGKTDASKFEKSLKDYVKADGLSISVVLITDEKQFIRKTELMSDSRDGELSQEDKRRMHKVWEAVSCICF